MAEAQTDPGTPARGTFYLDAFPEECFAGFRREGDSWNGWACPLFSEEEARRIAAFFDGREHPVTGEKYRTEYDAETDAFRFWDPDDEWWDEFEAVDVEGHTLYPVGTRVWTWREATAASETA